MKSIPTSETMRFHRFIAPASIATASLGVASFSVDDAGSVPGEYRARPRRFVERRKPHGRCKTNAIYGLADRNLRNARPRSPGSGSGGRRNGESLRRELYRASLTLSDNGTVAEETDWQKDCRHRLR